MAKKMTTKVLCCLVVIVILMMPVSVFAINGDNKSTGNTLKRSDETIMPFLTDNNTSITIKSGDNLEEIKFKGTLTFQKFLCGWGGYYFKVDKMDKGSIPVDDEIRVTVTYGGDAFDNYDYPLEIGDKAEIYAIMTHDYKFHDNHIGHEVWGATIMYSKYYVKKLESEPSLSISVWTDKPKYKIGETVTIYYKTNKKCTAKLTVTKPDGEKIVYGPNEMPACTRSKSATAGYPTGTRTVVFEAWADGKSKKSTCYFNVADEKKPKQPSPEIIKVIYPSTCINEGEYATISVTVENNGGPTSEGYISVSFPNDEYIPPSRVSGTGNEYNTLYPKKSEIWGKYGEIKSSEDPLVELFERNWEAGKKHTLTMSVKPNSGSDEIVFYVRAALKNDADGSYERDPTYTGYKDQQGWYVKKYSVDVCVYEVVKIRGKIIADHPVISYYNFNVKIDGVLEDPTGNLQEGETVTVYGHRDGPAHVDDVTVGDEVEVFGEYRGYVGTHEQIFLSEWGESSSDHYVKKIFRFDLVVTDISFSRLPYEKEPVTITATVKNNGDYGESNVHVTFLDGLDEIGYKVINYIPAHQSATTAIQWEDPEKSWDPTKSNGYYTNNIGASVNGVPYLKGVTVGDSGGIGYTLTLIKNSKLPVEVPHSAFGQLFLFDSKERYIGILKEGIKGSSEFLNRIAPEMLDTAAKLCMAEITISALLLNPHVGIALCLKGLLPGAIAQVTANLLSYVSEHWSDQVPYSYAVGPSPDGNIQIMRIVSFNVISEHEKKKSSQFNSDYYYKNKNGEWKLYYTTKEDIIYMSPNQISGTIKCPANLHAYDSEGRHVGLNSFGEIELEIPGSYYLGPEYEPESIVLLNQSGDIIFEINALDVGEFDFTLMQSTDTKTTTITHLDVPITQATEATVDVSKTNPTYTMEIDNNGDGITDYTNEPDSIETIGSESPVHNHNLTQAPTPFTVTAWPSSSYYYIGSQPCIYFTVSKPCWARVSYIKQNSTSVCSGPTYVSAGTHKDIGPVVGYPTGTRSVVVDGWTSSGEYASTMTYYMVG